MKGHFGDILTALLVSTCLEPARGLEYSPGSARNLPRQPPSPPSPEPVRPAYWNPWDSEGLINLVNGKCPDNTPKISGLSFIDDLRIVKQGVFGDCRYAYAEWARTPDEIAQGKWTEFRLFTEGYGSGISSRGYRVPVTILSFNDLGARSGVFIEFAQNEYDRTPNPLRLHHIVMDFYVWRRELKPPDLPTLAHMEIRDDTDPLTLKAVYSIWKSHDRLSSQGVLQHKVILKSGTPEFKKFEKTPFYLMGMALCAQFMPSRTVYGIEYEVDAALKHRMRIFLEPSLGRLFKIWMPTPHRSLPVRG